MCPKCWQPKNPTNTNFIIDKNQWLQQNKSKGRIDCQLDKKIQINIFELIYKEKKIIMGRSQSKVKMPNNPWEAEQYRRQMHEQRRNEIENDLKRQKKAEKKRMKKGTKLDVLKTPQPPTRPTKETDADQDVIAKRRMQNQLALDSQSFVLNQIMLSIQFYSNYRR